MELMSKWESRIVSNDNVKNVTPNEAEMTVIRKPVPVTPAPGWHLCNFRVRIQSWFKWKGLGLLYI